MDSKIRQNTISKSDRAQATVEFALLLPLIFILGAVLLQLGLIVKTQIVLAHSTREGARALTALHDEELLQENLNLALSSDGRALSERTPFDQITATSKVRSAVLATSDLDPSKTKVQLRQVGNDLVEIQVFYTAGNDIPLISRWLFDIQLASSLTVAISS